MDGWATKQNYHINGLEKKTRKQKRKNIERKNMKRLDEGLFCVTPREVILYNQDKMLAWMSSVIFPLNSYFY